MSERFHNQLLRARVSRSWRSDQHQQGGLETGFLIQFTPTSKSLDPRFIAAGLYELASEMERRSHDLGARWAITVDASSSRITVELTPDDSAARAEQFLHDVLAGFNLQ